MREHAIRTALCQQLQSSVRPSPVVLEELRLGRGVVRADVVAVYGHLDCYEIKSSRDTLQRLVKQGWQYGRVFDHVTLVTAVRHLDAALDLIPDWWGVMIVDETHERLTWQRSPHANPGFSPLALAQLLEREEIQPNLLALEETRATRLPLYRLHELLAEKLMVADLKELVRRCLLNRTPVRADPLPA
ncbi:MmcB family DNA repair protein [Permianibacter sp. IMCC34836]|uniref:sce7726 family protein n=1 Tax=Permianibacter fluminis TaxID=2738515 RepID=UPI0015553F23|nr:MmcB family DNA repair protein [Permianibacter fluminis]NQD37782.1 MmcB family DNA repair protein [Permianibacter fluminis]